MTKNTKVQDEGKNAVPFSDEEFEAAKDEALENDSSIYVHKFHKPFSYLGKEYSEFAFDFESLSGADSLAVEAELQQKGINVIVPAFSPQYLIRISARACATAIGYDAFEQMSIKDYNKIRSEARSFLLNSEL